jgi:hypothetical protein
MGMLLPWQLGSQSTSNSGCCADQTTQWLLSSLCTHFALAIFGAAQVRCLFSQVAMHSMCRAALNVLHHASAADILRLDGNTFDTCMGLSVSGSGSGPEKLR